MENINNMSFSLEHYSGVLRDFPFSDCAEEHCLEGNIGCQLGDKFLIASDCCEYNHIFLEIKASTEGSYSYKEKKIVF